MGQAKVQDQVLKYKIHFLIIMLSLDHFFSKEKKQSLDSKMLRHLLVLMAVI